MTEQTLYEKQQAVKEKFDATAAEKARKETEVAEHETELARLQGEYRILEELRGDIAKVPATPAGDPASTLPADPLKRDKKEAKNGGK